MKVGDLVGHKASWTDDKGLEIAGLVLELVAGADSAYDRAILFNNDGFVQYFIDNLEVIYNGN